MAGHLVTGPLNSDAQRMGIHGERKVHTIYVTMYLEILRWSCLTHVFEKTSIGCHWERVSMC